MPILSAIRLKTLLLLSSLLINLFACSNTATVDIAALEDKVRNIAQLTTYELVYKDVSYMAELKKLFGFITLVDNRVLFSINIRVRAGLDFRQNLSLSPVRQILTNRVLKLTVTLPPATILLVDADEKSIREYFSSHYGKTIAMTDWEPQITKAKNRVRADAIGRGILQKAQNNAQEFLKKFLAAAGYQSVEFVASRTSQKANRP